MVKCGIIGCGVIAPTHIEGYRKLPNAEVIHLCDLVPEKMEQLGEHYGIARRSQDYRKLLADPEVQLVSICTDHASHAQIAVDALNAGKHVVCEKSLGRTPEDCERMVAAAKAHPELVAAGIFQHRYEETNRALRELVASGDLGKLIMMNLAFSCKRTNAYYEKDAWRGTIAGEGGGLLINQAIHHLDELRFYFGDVEAVMACSANLTHQGVIEVEDTASFVVEFASGLFGTVSATNSSTVGWRTLLTIVGSKANLEFTNEVPTDIQAETPELTEAIKERLCGQREKIQTAGKSYYGSGHTAELNDVVNAIEEKRQPEIPFAEAANSSEFVLAVYESARTGKRVKVPRH